MLRGRIVRTLASLMATMLAVATTWLLAGPAAAQKDVPPKYDELTASRPWTYLMAWALFAAVALLIAATFVGYLIKSREFRANQRRGGSK